MNANNFKKVINRTLVSISVGAIISSNLVAASANTNWNNNQISSADDLIAWQNKISLSGLGDTEALIAQDVRLQAMYTMAKKVAVRAAMSSKMAAMDSLILEHSRELDAIYNFSPLMIRSRVVPPVITESRDLFNQNGRHQIKLSDAVFDIAENAYFSSTPPNWRSYLKFSDSNHSAYNRLAYGAGSMKPKTKTEKEIWSQGTKDGWEMGSRQANIVLEQSMLRLNRDYVGMIKFHIMVLEGRITMPSINSYDLHDRNGGNRLVLGEELLEINVLPQFKNPLSGVGTTLRDQNSDELNMGGESLDLPYAIEDAPTRVLYDVVENIRNEKSITPEPWKDSLPLAQTKDPISTETNILKNSNTSEYQQPIQQQIIDKQLIEAPVEPAIKLIPQTQNIQKPIPSSDNAISEERKSKKFTVLPNNTEVFSIDSLIHNDNSKKKKSPLSEIQKLDSTNLDSLENINTPNLKVIIEDAAYTDIKNEEAAFLDIDYDTEAKNYTHSSLEMDAESGVTFEQEVAKENSVAEQPKPIKVVKAVIDIQGSIDVQPSDDMQVSQDHLIIKSNEIMTSTYTATSSFFDVAE